MSKDQVTELSAKLRTLAVIQRFTHDLFNARDFNEAATQAVNNSWTMLSFKSSSLIEDSASKAVVIAQYGQTVVNKHSRIAVLQCDLCHNLSLDGGLLTITRANAAEKNLPVEIVNELLGVDTTCFILELTPPASTPKQPYRLLWLLEYDGPVPSFALNSAQLLASAIAESLYFHRLCTAKAGWNLRRYINMKKFFWMALLAAVIICMFIKVPESANAEFTLKAPEITSSYAWFEGPIARCHLQNGSLVRKGDLIAEYDTSQLNYRLTAAESQVNEIKAELELEGRSAFTQRERLGMVKLLEPKLQSALVSVDEAKWYLGKSRFLAPADGILVLKDGRAELLTGKVVHAGDKIFDIYGGEGMIADIPLNERDSSILGHSLSATLFLHTAPERPIPVKILAVSPYPELTEQRTYCYIVRAELPADMTNLRYGMRGIAKISGERVFLGYHLFKSAVLYFRGI